jgi:hypothetical protein
MTPTLTPTKTKTPTPTLTPTKTKTPTPTKTKTPTPTPTLVYTTFYVKLCSCTGTYPSDGFMILPASFSIGSSILATNGGCYNIESQTPGVITLTWNSIPGQYGNCGLCVTANPCPTPTMTPTSTLTPTMTQTQTQTKTPTLTPTKTRTPTPTSGFIYLVESCCTPGITKFAILPSSGLGSRRLLIGNECFTTIGQFNGSPVYVGTLLPLSITNCAQCLLSYRCP